MGDETIETIAALVNEYEKKIMELKKELEKKTEFLELAKESVTKLKEDLAYSETVLLRAYGLEARAQELLEKGGGK